MEAAYALIDEAQKTAVPYRLVGPQNAAPSA